VDKERDKVKVLGMGAAQYMTKPLSIETVVAEIKKVTIPLHDAAETDLSSAETALDRSEDSDMGALPGSTEEK
jgi:DNA-binding response OmpR family regulator